MARRRNILPAPPLHQREARSKKRRGNASYTPPPPPFLPPRLPPYLASPPSTISPLPLIYDWNFAGETMALGRSDIASSGPWTADNFFIARLALARLTALAAAVRAHAPCTWGCSSWMSYSGVIHMRLICQNDVVASVTRSLSDGLGTIRACPVRISFRGPPLVPASKVSPHVVHLRATTRVSTGDR